MKLFARLSIHDGTPCFENFTKFGYYFILNETNVLKETDILGKYRLGH